ncbi:MAG: methyltransferase domain-containing protein [Thermodesulfobacteriota bacterium]
MSEEKKFDPRKRKKLNNPVRLQWVPAMRVVELMELNSHGTYLDVGAGTGYISQAIGELLNGPIIHALDIEPLMISEMETTLKAASWIHPQLMERNILSFADQSVDGVWTITVFHEFGDPLPILGEIYRVLRPGTALLVVDWAKQPEACEQGPPLDHRVAEEVVVANLKEAGFTDVTIEDGFTHHYGVVGYRPR